LKLKLLLLLKLRRGEICVFGRNGNLLLRAHLLIAVVHNAVTVIIPIGGLGLSATVVVAPRPARRHDESARGAEWE
jgi:hypothetical protein